MSQPVDTVEDEEKEEDYEPQVTSSNPEERKLARRLRIERRIEAIKKQHEQDGQSIQSVPEKSLLDKQTEASAAILEQLLVEGDEAVTNVRVGNETREVNRRAKESARRAEMIEKIEKESQGAEELFSKITEKWEIIAKYKDPLDISDSINSQKELCNDMIKQKDEIIQMLKEEIDTAELNYVQDQELQNEDIAELVRRIDKQVDLMRSAYKKELKMIEDAIIMERQLLVELNQKKWDALHKQRNVEEESNMQKKIEMADEFLQVFYDTRVANEEIYRETKIQLEGEIEELQLELEQLKANCLLNGEKLDYNYNILKKREEENLIIRSQQKRLINKLQDSINSVKRHMREYKEKSEEIINKLVKEIKKTRDNIFQIENKSDHICNVNDRKYHEVWDLNEEKAKELVNKIRGTDKIIHEQLLGTEWKPPTKNFMKKTNLPSYKEAMEELKSQKQVQGEKMKSSRLIFEDDGKEIPSSLLQSIFDKIAFRSGFLLEQTLNTILPELTDDKKQLIKADNVFNAIGLTEASQFKLIADLFLPYARCPICESKFETMHENSDDMSRRVSQMFRAVSLSGAQIKTVGGQESGDPIDIMKGIREDTATIAEIVNSELEEVIADDSESSEESSVSEETYSSGASMDSVDQPLPDGKKLQPMKCDKDHPIYVENANVYKILRSFVRMTKTNEDQILTLDKRLQRRRNSLSRLLSEEDVTTFWAQYANIFTKNHEDLWNGLLYGLKRYHAILEDRFKTYQEVVKLRKENAELRHMLKFCNFEKKKPAKKKKFMKMRVVQSTPNLFDVI